MFYTFSNGGAWSAWHCVQLMRSDIKYHHFVPLLAGFIFDSAPAYPYLHVAMRAASENIDGQVSKVAVSAWTGLQTVISTVVNFNPSARFWCELLRSTHLHTWYLQFILLTLAR